MFLQQYLPHPALQDFVKRIVVSSFSIEKNCSGTVIPFPPQPEHSLYFYPKNPIWSRYYGTDAYKEQPHSILVGPQLNRVDLLMGNDMQVVLVTFQPGGMYRLLGIPMNELLDTPVESSLLLGPAIRIITQQLAEAKDSSQMVDVVQNYLLLKAKSLKASLPLDQVLTQAIQQGKDLQVDKLAKNACVSIRQLERQFKERSGLPPKLFLRLVRFSNAWMMHERKPFLSWTSIAHTCEYADQMHMIRDFKFFSGVTPRILQNDLKKAPLGLQGATFV